MTSLDVLDETERLLREYGWQRTRLTHCMLGRAYEAAGARFGHAVEQSNEALHGALNAIRAHLGTSQLSLWNSESTRTFDEVLVAIEGGRDQLRKQADP